MKTILSVNQLSIYKVVTNWNVLRKENEVNSLDTNLIISTKLRTNLIRNQSLHMNNTAKEKHFAFRKIIVFSGVHQSTSSFSRDMIHKVFRSETVLCLSTYDSIRRKWNYDHCREYSATRDFQNVESKEVTEENNIFLLNIGCESHHKFSDILWRCKLILSVTKIKIIGEY